MKIVVIGGGIAGMTFASFSQKKGMDVVICEKRPEMSAKGHAFLMHARAISILQGLDAGGTRVMPGEKIGLFRLRRPEGLEVKKAALDSWLCIKRNDLLDFLNGLLLPGTIKRGRDFSHFIRHQDRIVAAEFTNGEREYGDIFIGADGGNSKVRTEILGKVTPTPVSVKEIVGVSCDKELGQRYRHTFVKFQHSSYGLSFGMIPTGPDEFVWFMQYDPARGDIRRNDPEGVAAFCRQQLKDFPVEVGQLLQGNDFSKTYIWNTTDFDLLPSFHRENIVLLGDAAHLMLPFTSAGTTNAIIGAQALSACLERSADHETAFREYYRLRAQTIVEHILLGRQLKKAFLFPKRQEQKEMALPFLSSTRTTADTRTQPALLTIKYFTDPICSTCWIVQPALKKMKLEYGQYLDMQYYMGGLLSSWETTTGKIKSPSDAARHWKEVACSHKMPIDGDIWIEDPLSSSSPPSIAVKAAHLQDRDKAILFLRRIREMVFLEKKNIMRWEHLEMAAFEVGLDMPRFKKDYTGHAVTAFRQDLQHARELQVTSFPTLIFSDGSGNSVRMKGYVFYGDLEDAILQLLPSARRQEFDREPISLFRQFPTMVEEEFALLSDLAGEEARKVLHRLNRKGYIDKIESGSGVLWKVRQ
jgi:2-polyprenyl-6-methoxyphenol hydroxylase-like FAD-dependent oxidoreductase/predicted DsbA family dithiol-disulfide isomerase